MTLSNLRKVKGITRASLYLQSLWCPIHLLYRRPNFLAFLYVIQLKLLFKSMEQAIKY